MKIAIYGTGKIAQRLLNVISSCENSNISIAYFVESYPQKEYFHNKKIVAASDMKSDDFELLVLALNYKYHIEDYLGTLKNYEEIKYKIVRVESFIANIGYNAISQYQSISLTCGLTYLASNKDMFIRMHMLMYDENYAKDSIHAYFELVEKYCNVSSNGVFMDIGANIGTTSIYVKKIMNYDLKVVGVEAGKNNYDLFRINCILNGVDEGVRCVNAAVGEGNYIANYNYLEENPGGSVVCENNLAGNTEKINVMTLKSLVEQENITIDDISYIWMDTEGYEAKIIIGSLDLFKQKKIPIFMEYNPKDYIKQGILEEFCSAMNSIYSGYIDMKDYLNGNENVIPISHLHDQARIFDERGDYQGDLFFF